MYQEIMPKVYQHCRQNGCHNETLQVACLVSALNYHAMGFNVDEAMHMTFAPSGEAIEQKKAQLAQEQKVMRLKRRLFDWHQASGRAKQTKITRKDCPSG